MTVYTLRNGIVSEIQPYNDSHAESISENLFDSLDANVIIHQRQELLSPGPEEVYSVCCVSENKVVGVCTGVRKRWYGERHRIEMVQVVVKDEFHGLGIARLMMREIAEYFTKYGVEILQISTEVDNANALAAYKKIGFVRLGILKDGLRYNGRYSDEVMMSMRCVDLIES